VYFDVYIGRTCSVYVVEGTKSPPAVGEERVRCGRAVHYTALFRTVGWLGCGVAGGAGGCALPRRPAPLEGNLRAHPWLVISM
jgi:hypothetical protein